MPSLPEPITLLIAALSKLPGIGPRSAERIALHLVQAEAGASQQLAEVILDARRRVRLCEVCGALTEKSPCATCSDPRRDGTILAVVERAVDIFSIEKSGAFRGKYHVLGGKISPLNGVEPDDLRIAELEKRIGAEAIHEIVIALGTDVEGDATSFYLAKRLAREGLKVTQIAHGLPAGSGLEFADEITLSRALEGRRELLLNQQIVIPPKAVVFDLGKVLVDFDYAIAVRRIALRSTITAPELGHLLLHTSLMTEYETGLLTNEEFFKRVCAATGFCGDLDEFAGLFGDIFTSIDPMIQLHAELRQRGLATYIFSNTNELAIRHIRRRFPFFSQFDGYIYSYEHRSMKPDARLYEVVERESGRRGDEILYLDDRPENLAAGAARGWRVILQESPEKSRAAVERMGVLRPVTSA